MKIGVMIIGMLLSSISAFTSTEKERALQMAPNELQEARKNTVTPYQQKESYNGCDPARSFNTAHINGSAEPTDPSHYVQFPTAPFPTVGAPYFSGGVQYAPNMLPAYMQMPPPYQLPYGQSYPFYMPEQPSKKVNIFSWVVNGLMVITPIICLGVGYWRSEFGAEIKEESIALMSGLGIASVLGVVQTVINIAQSL